MRVDLHRPGHLSKTERSELFMHCPSAVTYRRLSLARILIYRVVSLSSSSSSGQIQWYGTYIGCGSSSEDDAHEPS